MLLEAGARVAINRTVEDSPAPYNILADVKIKDVLSEVNRTDVDGSAGKLTTGAFYQIWEDQASFQHGLLAHLMDRVATVGAEQVDEQARQMIDEGVAVEEILRSIIETDFRVSRQYPEMFLSFALAALAPGDALHLAQFEANRRYVRSLSDVILRVLAYGGRRLRAGRSIEDLIWAAEALEVGYLLRSRSDPDIPESQDSCGWSALATAYVGIAMAFTEPVR